MVDESDVKVRPMLERPFELQGSIHPAEPPPRIKTRGVWVDITPQRTSICLWGTMNNVAMTAWLVSLQGDDSRSHALGTRGARSHSDATEVVLCLKSYHVWSPLTWCNRKSVDATHVLDPSDVRTRIKYNAKSYIPTVSYAASDVMHFPETMVKERMGFE